jgi:predicted nucleotide-binding protein
MTETKVFISYSHEDELWKEKLFNSLRVLERNKAVTLWDASNLTPGSNWGEEIENELQQSDIAILLVSASFLASDFIVNRELPALLKRRQKEGLAIIPVLIEECLWDFVPGIAELQFANGTSKPLSSLSAVERDKALLSITQLIANLSEALAERANTGGASSEGYRKEISSATQTRQREQKRKGHIFISHSKEDGDFAELLKLRLEREGYQAWVDSDRLDPGTDWREEIDQGIRGALLVIAVMTPDARISEYVTYEWAFAWGYGKKVIPIMLRQTTLHPRLATLQYLDFTNRIARPWSRLFEVLANSNNTGKT